jgi:NADPH-dependent ferric siderophore reductase
VGGTGNTIGTGTGAAAATGMRVRREPPAFRRVAVSRVAAISPRLVRVTLGGPELAGFSVDLPGASVRLLLPSPGAPELVVPTWRGNEFLLPDGQRPIIRTLTPLRVVPDSLELEIAIVIHGNGPASEWAATAAVGDAMAISGPGRGYSIAEAAPAFLLVGDESALPAIGQLLATLPPATPVQMHVEVADPAGRIPLSHPGPTTLAWHDLAAGAAPGATLVAAMREAEIVAGTQIWAAGEAAAMQRIRRHLFEDRGLTRAQATVRGYWKVGRGGDADEDG